MVSRIDLEGASARLEAIRKAESLTRAQMADTLGVDRSTYIKIEEAEREVRITLGLTVSERFGISLDFLYRGDFGSLAPARAEKIRPHLPKALGGTKPE